MSGYTPVFRSVFDGTLHGRWPQTGVWLALLAMADRHGNIDRSPQAIASDIGIGTEELLNCIAEFCAPDEMSRTREHRGRRLELIDPERPWGWRVLNHGKYREKARKAAYDSDRTASGADAARKAAARAPAPAKPLAAPPCPDVSRALPLSDSDSDTDTDKEEDARDGEAPPRASPPAAIGTPMGLNADAFARWEQYLRLTSSKMLNDFSRPAAMRRLVSFGSAEQQAATVEHCIANGWKTLNPIRDHGSAAGARRKTRFEELTEGRSNPEDHDDTFGV